MIRTFSKLVIDGNFLNLIKNIYKNPAASITMMTNTKLSNSVQVQSKDFLSHHSFQNIPALLANAIR